MQLLGLDHLAREFLQRHRLTLGEPKQLAVQRQGLPFRIERLAQHGPRIVDVRVEQGADRQ